jgi:ribosomal protein S18 acetylase RimI-like enzyme
VDARGRDALAGRAESEQSARMDTPAPARVGIAVRPARADDVDLIRSLAVGNGMFEPEEMGGFDTLLHGYLDGSLDEHRWLVAADSSGGVAGAAYYAPEPFADRVWNLYFLAVDPQQHRGGIGAALVAHVEESLRGAGNEVARVLIVETSSTGQFEGARRFYRREGFEPEARIREFYGPDDDKIVFWKSLG